MRSDLSVTDKKCIKEVFERFDYQKQEIEALISGQETLGKRIAELEEKNESGFRFPINIGEKVYTVIFDDKDAEGWFICEDTVTDISRKGVWCSGMLPPQDDCSVLYEWDEFGKEVFADYDEAKREVEKKKCRT
jgi:hypothetical protein